MTNQCRVVLKYVSMCWDLVEVNKSRQVIQFNLSLKKLTLTTVQKIREARIGLGDNMGVHCKSLEKDAGVLD